MAEVLAASLAAAHPVTLDHLPVEMAQTLLRFRDDLLTRFPGQIRHMILFGSQARGDAAADSDVDVLVVVPWWGEALRRGEREIGEIAYSLLLEGCAGFLAPFVVDEHWFERDTYVAEEARREGFDLLTAQLVDGLLSAAPVANTTPVATVRETPTAYATEEPADLDNPQTWLIMATDKLRAARVLLTANCYDDVISVAYYAILYAAKAALLAEGVKVKSHRGAVSEFSRVFVNSRRVASRYGSLFQTSLRDRLSQDYAPDRRTTPEEAASTLADAEEFMVMAQRLVESRL